LQKSYFVILWKELTFAAKLFPFVMTNRNYFSDKFEFKESSELLTIATDDDFQDDAKMAALWELERRGETNTQQTTLAANLQADQKKTKQDRKNALRYHTFGRRFWAAVIDGFVLVPISTGIGYLLDTDNALVIYIGQILNYFAPYLYSVIMHGQIGQTFGKMAMGVKVIDVGENSEITFKQACFRDGVPIVCIIALFLYAYLSQFLQGIGFDEVVSVIPLFIMGLVTLLWPFVEIVSMLFNDKSRAVHDYIAGTVVVRVD